MNGDAALDFMTNPPTPLLNSAGMPMSQGVASHADQNGNLLFYTNGATVYNMNHVVMANGTGLFGNNFGIQTCLIVQKPGTNNLHYIFTIQGNGGAAGFNYSIVDMSMAAGIGSVTVKNASIYPFACDEKITGTLHCNGSDYWIVIHEENSNIFRSYLFSASGLNTTAVVSPVGTVGNDETTTMKISPVGNKLASIERHPPSQYSSMVLYDFNTSTGIISNQAVLYTGFDNTYGVEFSPDGSRLYSGDNSFNTTNFLHQWDICAGSFSAVVASHYTVIAAPMGEMQLAINDKIYVATGGTNISVISTPNNVGSACGFILAGQSLGGKFNGGILPNFISKFKTSPVPFNNVLNPSLGCHAVTFTANLPNISCAASNYSVSSVSWNFGDPSTGTLNVSSAYNPTHKYSSSGTFTVALILQYNCGADTIRQVVSVPPPDIAVTWSSSCNNSASATVTPIGGIGPYSYSWTPGSQTSSIVTNLSAGTHTITLTDQGLSCNVSTIVTITTKSPPFFSLSPIGSISLCPASYSVIQITGNASSYLWSPVIGLNITGTTVFVNPASSQTYSIVGTLNSCTTVATLKVDILIPPIPSIIANNNTLCVNSILIMEGFGGEKFQWKGPDGFLSSQKQFSLVIKSGNASGSYSLTVSDINGCKSETTVIVAVVPPPQGELKGIVPQGCAPLCSDYIFEGSSMQQSLSSTWEINGNRFADKFTYCFNNPGVFVITGTVFDTLTACSNTVTYWVNVMEKPMADFNFIPEILIESDEDVLFVNTTIGSDQTQWSWFFYGAQETPAFKRASGESTTNRFTEAGSYVATLVVKNKWQCEDTVIKAIIVHEDFVLYVPNSFTPNDDLRNDLFLPVTRGVKSFTLRIFNRWGTLLFESTDQNKGWDGTYKGQPVEQDTYVWTITATSFKSDIKTNKGHLTLLR